MQLRQGLATLYGTPIGGGQTHDVLGFKSGSKLPTEVNRQPIDHPIAVVEGHRRLFALTLDGANWQVVQRSRHLRHGSDPEPCQLLNKSLDGGPMHI